MTRPSAISISQPLNSFFFCDYRHFRKPSKHIVRRPHPLSLLTTTQASETCRFAAHMHPQLRRHPHLTPYRRNWDRAVGRTHRGQPRLALMSLQEFVSSSACIRWGDTNWWVVRKCANGGVNSPPLLETPAVAENATPPPSIAYTTNTRLRVELQHGVQRQRQPNRTHLR